ncbi:TetR/AcrR family transcriptional regulator [Streptomyces sp. R302]|uniref:TetR/AcrR family transcriptional regulator C-terminal domain-containing protein n=1 Tax=unclassified Streptomyces TaxID=2593676 RepID=UPI00145C4F99|nr:MULTISPECIES: TetR/AcrR family transcriptional regulator C-terminal domain-containing protein [unclassified Streptomyces]NML48885.1 TetR/AcrR family transcriptional regulator [Streptomyces sp. R301]NML77212.1 TetR/AcrR family transcriptional regulator [Streptomyces sp. R302]
MPRPRSLTPERLAAAALAVVDRDGLAALSMRTAAKELGMSPMGLYRYVSDREELERLVVDRILGAVDTTPPPRDTPWRERVELMTGRLREAVARHPEAVPLTLTHRHRSPGGLRWSETVLGILTEAGIDGPRRVVALRALHAYVTGAIQLEHRGPLAGSGTETIAGLPVDTFPLLTATARDAGGVTPDEEFSGGLRMLLRGLGG